MKQNKSIYVEIIKYLIVGGLTTLINLVVYYVLVSTVLDSNITIELQIATVISWIISVLFAYITNRICVFQSKNENKAKEISQFFVARFVTLLFDMIFMYLTVTVFHGNDKFYKLIGQIVIIISNYILSKLFVFKSRCKEC